MQSNTREKNTTPFDPTWLETLGTYLKLLAISFAIYAVVWLLWRQYILVDFSTIFTSTVPLGDALYSVRWLFAWPLVVIAFSTFVVTPILVRLGYETADDEFSDYRPGEIFTKGLYISFCAGIFEELLFRWLSFSVDMPVATFFNWITFGLYRWCMVSIVLPVANWATFGYLQPQLLGTEWVIGAAILMTTAHFRSKHNRGIVNKINAWFLSMVFFYMMFHYGIFSAIAAHIIYDCIVFAIMAVVAAFSQR